MTIGYDETSAPSPLIDRLLDDLEDCRRLEGTLQLSAAETAEAFQVLIAEVLRLRRELAEARSGLVTRVLHIKRDAGGKVAQVVETLGDA